MAGTVPARPAFRPARRPRALARLLARFDGGEVAWWVFGGLLAATVGMMSYDLADLVRDGGWRTAEPEPASVSVVPVLDMAPARPATGQRRFAPAPRQDLAAPMRFSSGPGGTLTATGTIVPGTAKRLAAEIETRSVRVLSLNSPGGALDEAIAMAELVRRHGMDTQVREGALCASSCPLLFAGGVGRRADEGAAIGVHQFYAAETGDTAIAQAMSDTQMVTARISRHLSAMGVDPAAWLHALDTPPRALYYFSPAELARYRFVAEADPYRRDAF